MGIGLAAACGFRVFVPLLFVSVAARADLVEPSSGFLWLESTPAIITLSVATLLEVGAYYLPWLDNLLDAVTGPAAVIAGTVVTGAVMTDMDPLLKWSLALIAGGGAAATIKTGLAGLRIGSSAITGGAGNPAVSTVEWISAALMSVLAIALPILAAILALLLIVALWYILRRIGLRLFGRRSLDVHHSEPA